MTRKVTESSRDRHGEPAKKPVRFSPIEQECLDSLNELGFDRPVEFIRKYGARRIGRALGLLRAKARGQVKNPAGIIRYLVNSPHALPPPARTPDDVVDDIFRMGTETVMKKFREQKYGRIVQR